GRTRARVNILDNDPVPPPQWQNGSPTFTWTNLPEPPPVVTNPGSQTSAEGSTVSLHIQASDPQGQTVTFAAVNLPTGLSIDPATGIIFGTIDYSAAEAFGGHYDTTVIVADGHGGSASQTFAWTVTDTDRAPTLTNVGPQHNFQGDVVSLQVQATDPDND